MEQSTDDQSKKSKQKTFEGLGDAISSLESEDGTMPCDSQDGPKSDPPGLDPVRVSRFHKPEGAEALKMNGICGLFGNPSSPTVILQQSLESRLLLRMADYGSIEYVLTWKRWDMQLGPPICALRASTLHICDTDCGGWPTPMAGSKATETYNEAGNTDSGRKTMALVAGWPTPRTVTGGAESAKRKQELGRTDSGGGDLQAMAQIAGWATPATRDFKGTNKRSYEERGGEKRGEQLPNQVKHHGPIVTTISAETDKCEGYRLNPRFSLWLQGYPIGWALCAEQVTPSSRKSRRSS